mmetsp:Transcript_4296/g.14258  ORF Transcript_4296/g.14258 Transcript_4296/m.14258 type:complete len:263 (+) Transcript_4296:541-1329(+)
MAWERRRRGRRRRRERELRPVTGPVDVADSHGVDGCGAGGGRPHATKRGGCGERACGRVCGRCGAAAARPPRRFSLSAASPLTVKPLEESRVKVKAQQAALWHGGGGGEEGRLLSGAVCRRLGAVCRPWPSPSFCPGKLRRSVQQLEPVRVREPRVLSRGLSAPIAAEAPRELAAEDGAGRRLFGRERVAHECGGVGRRRRRRDRRLHPLLARPAGRRLPGRHLDAIRDRDRFFRGSLLPRDGPQPLDGRRRVGTLLLLRRV